MRHRSRSRAVFAALILAGATVPAPAQITIDNFFVPTSLLQATPGNPVDEVSSLTIGSFNAARRITAEAVGGFNLDTGVDGTGWIIDGGGTSPGSASALAEYVGFSLNLGTNYFLEFAVDRVFGAPVLGLILQSSSSMNTLSAGATLTTTTNGYSVFFDLRTLGGYSEAFLNGVNDIEILVGGADQDFFVEAAYVQFSPVPEPGTWALLAAGTGVLLVARCLRRRASVRRDGRPSEQL